MTTVYKGALRYEHAVTADQNRSRDMQDAFTYSRTELGTVFGVFDGHGGHDISNYASTHFASRFFEHLSQGKSHRDVFQRTILSIQNDIKNENCKWGDAQGTTAVVSYIDLNHRIYTATLGDSEAKIYRMIGDQLKSIPISCMRDWCSPKDSLVFAEHRRPFLGENAKALVQHIQAKDRRIGWHDIGLNVSRGIGLVNTFYVIHPKVTINLPMSCLHLWPEMRIPLYFSKEGILRSIKPKITMFQPQPGDILILGSDGLFDSLPEHRIIEIILEAIEGNRLPELTDILAGAAKQNEEYKDNITVVAVTFTR